MAITTTHAISMERIATPDALNKLVQSFSGLPNNPPSFYLTMNLHGLVIYVALISTVNVVSLPYLVGALHKGQGCAFALKSFFETSAATKVFFDARMATKILSDHCGIELVNPPCTERAHIHEVQMMELALRRRDTDRERLATLDRCIARDSNINIGSLVSRLSDRRRKFDERILHLPVLWRKYHEQLVEGYLGLGGPFWIAQIREATQNRLAVSRGENHTGYSIDSARIAWDKNNIDEQAESWNDDVMMDKDTDGEFLGGADHWARFCIL